MVFVSVTCCDCLNLARLRPLVLIALVPGWQCILFHLVCQARGTNLSATPAALNGWYAHCQQHCKLQSSKNHMMWYAYTNKGIVMPCQHNTTSLTHPSIETHIHGIWPSRLSYRANLHIRMECVVTHRHTTQRQLIGHTFCPIQQVVCWS